MTAPVIELTIMAAEGLKSVSVLRGKMAPFAVAFVDPHRKFSTRVLHRGGKNPVWNDRVEIPLEASFLTDVRASLTIQVFHQSSIKTSVSGATQLQLQDLLRHVAAKENGEGDILTLQLFRPSGRPHGIIRVFLKISGDGLPSLSRFFGGEYMCDTDTPVTGIPLVQMQNSAGYQADKYSYHQMPPAGFLPYPKPPYVHSQPGPLPYPAPPTMGRRRNNNFLMGLVSGAVAAVLLGVLF